MNWRLGEINQLINTYKSYEHLWDPNNPSYKHVDLRRKTWIKIADEFGKDVAEVKKKIKHLRTAYVVEKKKLDSSLLSGESEGTAYEPHLFYFNEMRFLDPVVFLRTNANNCNYSESINNTSANSKTIQSTLEKQYTIVDDNTLIENKRTEKDYNKNSTGRRRPLHSAEEVLNALLQFDIFDDDNRLKTRTDAVWVQVKNALQSTKNPISIFLDVKSNKYNLLDLYKAQKYPSHSEFRSELYFSDESQLDQDGQEEGEIEVRISFPDDMWKKIRPLEQYTGNKKLQPGWSETLTPLIVDICKTACQFAFKSYTIYTDSNLELLENFDGIDGRIKLIAQCRKCDNPMRGMIDEETANLYIKTQFGKCSAKTKQCEEFLSRSRDGQGNLPEQISQDERINICTPRTEHNNSSNVRDMRHDVRSDDGHVIKISQSFSDTPSKPSKTSLRNTTAPFEEVSIQDQIDIESISSAEDTTQPPAKRRQIEEHITVERCGQKDTQQKSSGNKYDWLSSQVLYTLNAMRNEDIIDTTVFKIQRILHEAKTQDRKWYRRRESSLPLNSTSYLGFESSDNIEYAEEYE